MTVNIDSIIEKTLLKIMKQIDSKPIIPIEFQVWDEHDIANYFKYTVDYTKRNIMSNKYFPPGRELPTDPKGERTSLRWKATDIIKYAMAFDKSNLNYS